MADTGAKYPNANTAGSTPWLNPDNAYADDGNYAICSGDMVYKDSYWHGFDFSAVPAGATIDGIKLTVEAYNTSGNANIWDYGLSPDGGSNVYRLAANLGPFGTTPTVVSVGGATEKWGRTWSVSELSTSNFRVWIKGYATTAQSWYMDYIRVTVYYTEPDTEPTVTTSAVSDKATTSGTGNGEITDTGGQNATRRGFCYKAGSSGDPTISDSVVYDDGDFGTGSFSKSIPGLTAGTQYRVRAYATNSIGTGYGTTVDFTTTFKKIITETILVLPSIQRLTSKIISARLVVTDVITKLVTFTKTLTEIVISSDIYQKIINLQRTFTEIVIINATFSKIQNLTRTLSESLIIKDARERVLTAYKTLIENVKASDLYEKSASLFKLLSEALTASDLSVTIQKQFLSTFTEVVQAVDKISFTTTRIFSEAIKVVSGVWYNTSRTFIETIKTSDTYNSIASFVRTLTENIKVGSSKLYNLSKTLLENVFCSVYDPIMIRIKGLYETIIVSGSHVFDTTRQFVEKVYVGAQKLTYRAFSFFENLIVVPVFGKLQTKRLLEYVKAFDVIIPNKMQRAILTDAFKVVSGFTRSLSRNFFEIINVVGNIASKTTRIFTEAISVTTNFVGLFGHVLWERLTVAGSIGSWVIGKTIVQIVKVADSVGKASAWVMSEVIKVSGSAIVIANKILIETIKVITAIRFSIGRVITHTIRVGNVRIFRHIFYTIKTESFKVLDNIAKQSGKIFTQSLNVIDAIGNWSVAKLFIERIKIIDNYVKAWTLSRVYQESINIGSTLYHQIAKIFTENVKVVGTFIAGTPAKVFYETIKVAQTIAKSMPKLFEETIKVVGSGINQSGKIFGEAISVAGEFVLGTISKLFIEQVKIVQNFVTGGTFYKTFAEVIKVAGNGFNRAGKIFTETVIVAGTFVLGTISKVFIETVKIVQKFNVSMSRVFTQVINVVAGLTNRWGRTFNEIVSIVSPVITKLTGRLFTERIAIDWDKIKLVLNGIQVGLWKKVARITNGVWKKISRNDTL